MTTRDYEDKVGGLAKCLNDVAEGVLLEDLDSGARVNSVAENALRVGFVREMVGYQLDHDMRGRFVRKKARWDDLPRESHDILTKMSSEDFRLVTIDHRDDTKTVEVTHEAIFRQWETLRNWLGEQLDLLQWRADVERSCLLYTSPSPRDQRGSRMPSSA